MSVAVAAPLAHKKAREMNSPSASPGSCGLENPTTSPRSLMSIGVCQVVPPRLGILVAWPSGPRVRREGAEASDRLVAIARDADRLALVVDRGGGGRR